MVALHFVFQIATKIHLIFSRYLKQMSRYLYKFCTHPDKLSMSDCYCMCYAYGSFAFVFQIVGKNHLIFSSNISMVSGIKQMRNESYSL